MQYRSAGLWRAVLTGLALFSASPTWAAENASCLSKAATSAALAACKTAAAPAPLVSSTSAAESRTVPATPPIALQEASQAPAKAGVAPPSGAMAAGSEPVRKKKIAKRKIPDPVIVAAPDAAPPEPPSLFGALFGQGATEQPSAAVASNADPVTTGATGPLNAGKGKGKGKGVKTAKANDAAAPAQSPAPDGGFFDAEQSAFASADLGYPVLSPANIEPTKAAIRRYGEIVAAGGWPVVDPLQMQVGTNNPAVAALRQRLKIEGDLKSEPSGFSGPEYFDQEVADALKRWQGRYGLAETGDLMDPDRLKNGTRTIMALNVAADSRLAQLKANLPRLQAKPPGKGRYVIANLPSEQIEAVEDNRVVLRLNGVIGRPDRPSPLLTSSIAQVKFNPTWTVPPTVLTEDLAPKGRAMAAKGQDALAKLGIDAFDGGGRKVDTSQIDWNKVAQGAYRLVQPPGKENPLGFAKLDFPSPESVYMHDTPSNKLFSKSYRAASSGCIRVEYMDRLVTWLLKDTDGWPKDRVAGYKQSGESKIVSLKRAVPLQWVYITAWATEDGKVHFRRDLYSKDVAFGVSRTASLY